VELLVKSVWVIVEIVVAVEVEGWRIVVYLDCCN